MAGRLLLTDTGVEAMGADWIRVQTAESPSQVITEIDSVIVCAGYEPRDGLAKSLRALVLSLDLAGDVQGSRKLFQAVAEGTLSALQA